MKKIFGLALLSMFVLAACGGGTTDVAAGNVGTSGSVSNEAAAVSTVVSGGASSAGTTGASGTSGVGQSSLSKAISVVVAKKLQEEIAANDASMEKTPVITQTGNSYTITFNNETYSEGGGTLVLDGYLTFTENSQTSFTADGNLSATLTGVTETVSIDGTDYTETITGSFAITFDGTATVANQALTLNFTITSSGQNITVTGTVDGTVSSFNYTATISGNSADANSLAVTCGGAVTVTTSGGTETCNLTSDCLSCQ